MKTTTPIIFILALTLSLAIFRPPPATAFTPHQGDYFTYHEIADLGSGTGYNYSGYTEHTVVNGSETMNNVFANGTVSAHYGYTWAWSSNTGQSQSKSESGNFTFSSTNFSYIRGTDNQTGYVHPYVWFCMDNTTLVGDTFYLLNTAMTVKSTSYSYHLASQNGNVNTIFAEGTSSYQRNDVYGKFSATYTWDTYFDPVSGYIVGYSYNEQDTNSTTGDGFTYTENLYVTSTSYPLTAAAATSNLAQYLVYIAALFLIILVIVILAVAISRRSKRLPKHTYPQVPVAPPQIDLTPREQPPVQQIVIKEVVKVKCRYCGALIDSTVQTCPFCGAPRT
jgi:hypothetical protein